MFAPYAKYNRVEVSIYRTLATNLGLALKAYKARQTFGFRGLAQYSGIKSLQW